MKNRIISIIVIIAFVICFVGVSYNETLEQQDILTTAAQRDISTVDRSIVYISDEFVALAGSPQDAAMGKDTLANINELRAVASLSSLEWSNALATAAEVRAKEAFTTWSHTRPDGTSYWTVNSEIMYGENLAKGYSTSDAITAAWYASQSHRENMLFANYKTCGIAFYTAPDGMIYTACEFGY